MNRSFEYGELTGADLHVDALYKPERSGTGWCDPMSPLVGVRRQGGFRWRGKVDDAVVMVLFSNLGKPEWPNRIDERTGEVVYYGDNKVPGRGADATPGNRWLLANQRRTVSADRAGVAPVLIFASTALPHTYQFKGLAAQTGLVSRWYDRGGGSKFENYEGTFVILDVPVVRREWLDALMVGKGRGGGGGLEHPLVPAAWREWIESGILTPLVSDQVPGEARSRGQQLPVAAEEWELLEAIWSHFPKGADFDAFARWVLLDMHPSFREHGDGSVVYRINVASSHLDVRCEVKATSIDPRGRGIGVAKMASFAAGLTGGRYGVYVTTGYVSDSARMCANASDGRIMVVCGADIAHHLRKMPRSAAGVGNWLRREFPS